MSNQRLRAQLLKSPAFNASDLSASDLFAGQYEEVASAADVVMQEELLQQASKRPKNAYRFRKNEHQVDYTGPPPEKAKV